MNSDIIVVDDFLHKVTQKQLEVIILGNNSINWVYRQSPNYFIPAIENKFKLNDSEILDKSFGDFSHWLVSDFIKSEVYDLFPNFKNLIQNKFKIKVKNIKRISINFAFPVGVVSSKYDTPHCDLLEGENCKSVVCYINDSDGDTVFFDEFSNGSIDTSKKTIINRISPKAGKAVLFDSTRYHSGSFPSKKIRLVVNIVLIVENE
jgi:hypothetical protein